MALYMQQGVIKPYFEEVNYLSKNIYFKTKLFHTLNKILYLNYSNNSIS